MRASMAVFGDGHTSGCCDPVVSIAHDGMGVCDGAHGVFVMKRAGVLLNAVAPSGDSGF